jgi:hypothetical protein
MRHRGVIIRVLIRLIALLVLVTSGFDYCAFDVWDPTAPMSLTRSEAIRDLVPDHQTSVNNVTNELPDDQCLGCAPSILPRPFIVHRLSLEASAFQAAEVPVPSSDRFIPKRPPRA